MRQREWLGLLVAMVVGVLVNAVLQWCMMRPARGDDRTTEATLNVLYTNAAWKVAADVEAAIRRSSVIRTQEVSTDSTRRGISREIRAHPTWRKTGALTGGARSIPILWNTRVWKSGGPVHQRLMDTGHGVGPSRWLTWKTLRFRPTGQVVTVANTHAVARYCSRTDDSRVRDRSAARHWRRVVAWTYRQETRHPGRTILLGGDFNCRLQNHRRWYYPGPMLDDWYRPDRAYGVDRLITSRTPSHPTTVRRWWREAYSDHRLHLRRLAFR
jgi:hypothetical protein